jgi:hypothetical protein
MQPGRDGKMGHYLRRNDKVWTPPHLITIDSESWRKDRGNGEDQTLRLWCARLDDRRKPEKRERQQLREHGLDCAGLATIVDKWCQGRETIWLYAHNLGYDLTTTQLIQYLASMGWTLDSCSTVPDYLFLFMSKGRKRLTLTDSHHLLPMALADVGSMLGLDKLPMPSEDAPDDDWLTYCARDVDVLAEAVLTLMGHWDDYALGNWSVSGASCGFRAMRHMLPPRSLVVIHDPESSKLSRQAIYGGRRYCWRHGEQPPGRYAELDFTAAHATTAASHPMPVKPGTYFNSLPVNHPAVDGKLAVVIAECEIQTDTPRFPVKANGRVWYPVGRFKTVLSSPEIAWARDLGCLVSIGRGQFHYTSRVLQPFFNRVLDVASPAHGEYPLVVRAMWKQWGRSVIGKFAQPGYKVTQTRMLTDKVWHYEKAQDWETGLEYWLVHYAGYIHEARQDGDGSSAYPAILALVESYERVAIGKSADLLGDGVLIQCDTDGMWVDVGALESGAPTGLGFNLAEIQREARIQIAIDCVNQQLDALQLREKHNVMRIAVWGPQNMDAGPHSRHSGRPKGVREIRDGVWAGDTFPSVAHQQAKAAPGVYRTEAITWTRPANVIPGWVLADGTVRAVEAATGEDGQPCLVPWDQTRWARAGARLWPIQHDALEGLWLPAAEDPLDQAPNVIQLPPAAPSAPAGPPAKGLARIKLRQARAEHAAARDALRRHRQACAQCGRLNAQPDAYCDTGYSIAQALGRATRIASDLTQPAPDNQEALI